MMIPHEAIKKVVPVVEQLSHDIVMGGNDWETVMVSWEVEKMDWDLSYAFVRNYHNEYAPLPVSSKLVSLCRQYN